MTANLIEACLVADPCSEARQKMRKLRDLLLAACPQCPEHLQLRPHVTIAWLGINEAPAFANLKHRLQTEFIPMPTRVEAVGIEAVQGVMGWRVQIRLACTKEILEAQMSLLTLLVRVGTKIQDAHIGSNYRPHLTLVDGLGDEPTERLLDLAKPAQGWIRLENYLLFQKTAGAAEFPVVTRVFGQGGA